jgi:hypothetical protein
MHLHNCIWVVLPFSRLNLAFLSLKLSHGIDKVLVCLCLCGFDNPRNTLRWKLLQLVSVRLRIILLSLRTANIASDTWNVNTPFFKLGWAWCGSHKKDIRTSHPKHVFLHQVWFAGHVVRSGASGAWNVDVQFFKLRWVRCWSHKKHDRTCHDELVFLHPGDMRVT